MVSVQSKGHPKFTSQKFQDPRISKRRGRNEYQLKAHVRRRVITNVSISFPEESNLIKAQDAFLDNTPHEALSNTKQNKQLQPCPLPNCPFQHTATSLMLKVNTNDLVDLSQSKREEMVDCFPTIFAHKISINNSSKDSPYSEAYQSNCLIQQGKARNHFLCIQAQNPQDGP